MNLQLSSLHFFYSNYFYYPRLLLDFIEKFQFYFLPVAIINYYYFILEQLLVGYYQFACLIGYHYLHLIAVLYFPIIFIVKVITISCYYYCYFIIEIKFYFNSEKSLIFENQTFMILLLYYYCYLYYYYFEFYFTINFAIILSCIMKFFFQVQKILVPQINLFQGKLCLYPLLLYSHNYHVRLYYPYLNISFVLIIIISYLKIVGELLHSMKYHSIQLY